MTTVYIAHNISTFNFNRIRRTIDNVLKRDPDWNGAIIDMKRDDYTWIDTDDEIAGYQLLHGIVYPIINNE